MALHRSSLACVQACSSVYCHAIIKSNAIPSAWEVVLTLTALAHCSALQSKEFVSDVAMRGGEKVRVLSCHGLACCGGTSACCMLAFHAHRSRATALGQLLVATLL